PWISPVAGSLTNCGKCSPTRILPACTMSPTRRSRLGCCALAFATDAMSASNINSARPDIVMSSPSSALAPEERSVIRPKFNGGLARREPPRVSLALWPLHRLGDRAARQHADEMRTILGAAMDIAAHPIGLDRHAFERLRPKALLERL